MARLDRIIDSASSVVSRLNSTEPLSRILPGARELASASSRTVDVFWLDFEIYGAGKVPGQSNPLRTPDERAGFMKFWALHESDDITKITVDEVLTAAMGGTRPDLPRGYLIPQSISDLERILANYKPLPDDYIRQNVDDAFRLNLAHSNQEQVIPRVRAAVHQLASEVLTWAEDEKENQELLGRDYHLVLSHLSALDTHAGNELRSALSNLHSQNPADWSASALICRNVIIKLGDTLFVSSADSYQAEMSARTLTLKGQTEKNRLLAFIDTNWKSAATDVEKAQLSRAAELAIRVYELGSSGKRPVRFADAQQVVVDTFEMVSILLEQTNFEPIVHRHSGSSTQTASASIHE